MISYLNCLEYLTLHRDYKEGDIDELDRRCKQMYTLLVTKIGGLEGVTAPTTFTTLVADILYGCVVDGGIYGGTGTRGLKLSIELCHYVITSTTATEAGNVRVMGHLQSFAPSSGLWDSGWVVGQCGS
jgi:hypothetical protein